MLDYDLLLLGDEHGNMHHIQQTPFLFFRQKIPRKESLKHYKEAENTLYSSPYQPFSLLKFSKLKYEFLVHVRVLDARVYVFMCV